jgi:hypothetical protein
MRSCSHCAYCRHYRRGLRENLSVEAETEGVSETEDEDGDWADIGRVGERESRRWAESGSGGEIGVEIEIES